MALTQLKPLSWLPKSWEMIIMTIQSREILRQIRPAFQTFSKKIKFDQEYAILGFDHFLACCYQNSVHT